MPHHNTLRRVFQGILDEAEFNRLMQAYPQQAGQGEQLALDGKTLRGTCMGEEEADDPVLSVYEVQNQRVLARVAVARKENKMWLHREPWSR